MKMNRLPGSAKIIGVLLFIVSLVTIHAAGVATADYTKIYTSTADASVEYYNQAPGAANTNYGNDIHLWIGNEWYDGYPLSNDFRYSSLIFFNTGSDLNGKTILSAILRLYVYDTAVQKDGRYVAYGIALTWNEGTVTWNNKPTWWLAPNTEAYAPQINDEFTEWDVTEIVQYWANGDRINYGFYVEDVQVPYVCYMCADSQITKYISSEYTNASYRPKLVVTYAGVESFNLTVNTAGTGYGTVTGAGAYDAGTTATVTAQAATGSTFASWSGDCTGTANPTTVLMDRAKTCTANFTLDQFVLTVNTDGTGIGTVSGADTYYYGATATVTATAGFLSHFSGWSGDCTGTENPIHVFMDRAKTCTAIFTSIAKCPNRAVKINPGGGTYDHIQDAYDAASSSQFVIARVVTFRENLSFGANKNIALKGGYECFFNARTGFTTINGSLTIKGGTVTVGFVKIK
jgi:hypothetical protein